MLNLSISSFFIGTSRPLWKLLSGDIKSALMKGDVFDDEDRILVVCCTDPKVSPPVRQLARVREAVFGLPDAPREWWLKVTKSRALAQNKWQSLQFLTLEGRSCTC